MNNGINKLKTDNLQLVNRIDKLKDKITLLINTNDKSLHDERFERLMVSVICVISFHNVMVMDFNQKMQSR